MAIKPDVQLAPNVTPASAGYPYGSSKNETVPGLFDGTPYNLTRANDVFGLQQALLYLSGIVPSGSADTVLVSQYVQALVELAGGRAYNFTDSGVANAKVLSAQAKQQAPQSLFDGQIASFKVVTTNTGAVTVNLAGLGAKAVVTVSGAALTAGELTNGTYVTLRYNLALTRWELLGAIATVADMEAATDLTKTVTPGRIARSPHAAKAFANINGDANTFRSSLNCTAIASTSVGDYELTFDTDFSNTSYVCAQFGGDDTGTNVDAAFGGTDFAQNVGSFRFNASAGAGLADLTHIHLIFFGDQ